MLIFVHRYVAPVLIPGLYVYILRALRAESLTTERPPLHVGNCCKLHRWSTQHLCVVTALCRVFSGYPEYSVYLDTLRYICALVRRRYLR